MNTNKQERREKELRKLKKRSREVARLIREQPLTELKEPFQKGWEVYYKLRDDVARRRDAVKLQEKLELAYQPYRVVKTIKHVKMVRQGIKGYHEMRDGKRVYVSLGPDRKYLTKTEYNALDDHRKAWYTRDEEESRYYGYRYYRVLLPEHWVVLKTRPHIMTHAQEIDGDLESESALIWRKLEVTNSKWRRRWDDEFIPGIRRMETRMAIAKYLKGEADEIAVGRSQLY